MYLTEIYEFYDIILFKKDTLNFKINIKDIKHIHKILKSVRKKRIYNVETKKYN